MQYGDAPGNVTHTADPAAPLPAQAGGGPADQVLCIDGDRSFSVKIPSSGELVIGRGPGAGLPVDDPLVSRVHAQLLVVPDGLRLSDLGSRHGTLVNGERITEPRLVVSGDVITIGKVLLVVRRPVRAAGGSHISEPAMFVRRLGEELSRIAQYERELSVVIARSVDRDAPALLAKIADRLRVIDAVSIVGARFVGVLLPELGTDEADAFARSLGALGVGRVSAGVATAPYDGLDPDALLGAARAACTAAEPGQVVQARDSAETIIAGPQRILVADPAMARLYELARRLARSTIPILILGETGSGKELAAATVHAFSARAGGPFVSVNCAAIPENLAESELFGHARGAFSGAMAAKPGTSRSPRAARCSSTRSASCRPRSRPSSCACSRAASCSAWARSRRAPSTCVWSRPPTATSSARCSPGGSAPTCSSGWAPRGSSSSRCATGRAT